MIASRFLAGMIAAGLLGLSVPAATATTAPPGTVDDLVGPRAVPVSSTPSPLASLVAASAVESTGEDGLWRVAATEWPAPPAVDAASWILVDVATGQILDGHAEDLARPPASTTKLLTALAVSRRTKADDVVVVGDEVLALEGASAGLSPGDRVRVDDLLALLLLRSGNDAAATLAVHTAGSEEGFAALLEDEAEVLGLRHAVLAEPHGLFDRNRLSARSLAVIGRAVLADGRLRPMVGASTWTLSTGQVITNRNELLAAYDGATGLKTGMTRAAGWSLVASARHGQRHLVAVVLGGPTADSRFTSAAALLDHGFGAFAPAPPIPDLRVRGEGTWLEVVEPRHQAVLPLGSAPALVPSVPVEPTAPDIRWSWPVPTGQGHWTAPGQLAPVGPAMGFAPVRLARAQALTGPDADGTARLGDWLAGRLHAGMRAATVSGAWDRAEGP